MLTSKQRAILRGKANTMDPVYIVGKGEIDDTMVQGVKDCLDARELIKLKVLENSMYNAREASQLLTSSCGVTASSPCASCRKQPYISSRSAAGAAVCCLKGESPAGITTTRSGRTQAAAARRLFRWPLWGGSKLPP